LMVVQGEERPALAVAIVKHSVRLEHKAGALGQLADTGARKNGTLFRDAIDAYRHVHAGAERVEVLCGLQRRLRIRKRRASPELLRAGARRVTEYRQLRGVYGARAVDQ